MLRVTIATQPSTITTISRTFAATTTFRLLKRSASTPNAWENKRKGRTNSSPVVAITFSFDSSKMGETRKRKMSQRNALSLKAPRNWVTFSHVNDRGSLMRPSAASKPDPVAECLLASVMSAPRGFRAKIRVFEAVKKNVRHRTSNIQHPTSNVRHPGRTDIPTSTLDVRCWMLDVHLFLYLPIPCVSDRTGNRTARVISSTKTPMARISAGSRKLSARLM